MSLRPNLCVFLMDEAEVVLKHCFGFVFHKLLFNVFVALLPTPPCNPQSLGEETKV